MSYDPNWKSVISLLHFDEDFTDEAGNTAWESTNGATITSDNDPVWGNRLGYNGTSNIRSLSGWDARPINPDNFTVELRYTPDSLGVDGGVWAWGDTNSTTNRLHLTAKADGSIAFFRSTADATVFQCNSAASVLQVGVESVIQAQCDGTNALLRHNGVQQNSVAYNSAPLQGPMENRVGLSRNGADNRFMRGPIDEFRLTNTIRYPSDYTPATEPFTYVEITYATVYPTYPESFACPTWAYSETTSAFALRTQFDSGWTRQRVRWPDDRNFMISMSFIMDTYEFSTWSKWIHANCESFFYITLGDTLKLVRVAEGPAYSYTSFDRVNATLMAEVRDA